MTDQLAHALRKLNREVNALSLVLLVLAAVLVVRVGMLVYVGDIDRVWTLFPHLVALVVALLISRTANRHIVHSDMVRTEERQREIVRTTHHLIAITKDLLARVGYVRKIFAEGGRPAIALVKIAETIESRYETLLQPDAYTYLSGNHVDLISRMSGTIYGISAVAAGVSKTLDGPAASVAPIPPGKNDALVAKLDELTKEIDLLIDGLFELRYAADGKNYQRGQQHVQGES